MSKLNNTPVLCAPRTVREHFVEAFRARKAWLPISFYFMMLIPVVLLLCVNLLEDRAQHLRFVSGAALLFVFFGVLLQRAVVDLLEIARRMLREKNSTWDQTVGQGEFVQALGERVRQQNDASITGNLN